MYSKARELGPNRFKFKPSESNYYLKQENDCGANLRSFERSSICPRLSVRQTRLTRPHTRVPAHGRGAYTIYVLLCPLMFARVMHGRPKR